MKARRQAQARAMIWEAIVERAERLHDAVAAQDRAATTAHTLALDIAALATAAAILDAPAGAP